MLWLSIHTYNTSSSQTQGLNFLFFVMENIDLESEQKGIMDRRYCADGDGGKGLENGSVNWFQHDYVWEFQEFSSLYTW